MARRARRKAEETRQDVLDMAESVFRENGFSGTTIADIASALDMSPANVFKHFRSKTALAEAIAERHVETLVGTLEGIDTSLPTLERLGHFVRRLMESHLRSLRQSPCLFEIVLMTSGNEMACGRRYKELLESRFVDMVRLGADEGVYFCEDVEKTARCISACFACVLHPVFLARYKADELRTRCDEVIEFVNRSLTNPLAR
ncbi:TetR family transcriptional regulator [Rhizobiaceae bacterium BDR2-2]|uniref:TetR family transcriptional regulator n=1 Tax=Ectorhizobium quercum TaxID=2965071 RepID=A0AAE3N5G7_9HYPH|nr:TetR family transcriptional regulator [Ectorhizobium quercum]MCX8999615.1 TetR family transcriptional regulator [Ectorhizobium quercum]